MSATILKLKKKQFISDGVSRIKIELGILFVYAGTQTVLYRKLEQREQTFVRHINVSVGSQICENTRHYYVTP
jgi:hypothetical protein